MMGDETKEEQRHTVEATAPLQPQQALMSFPQRRLYGYVDPHWEAHNDMMQQIRCHQHHHHHSG
jgi:hypothetical protein